MRTRLSLFLTLLLGWHSSAKPNNNAQIPVTIDARFELVAILGYLSGFDEYSNPTSTKYGAAVDLYFDAYKNHEAVTFLKEARKKYRIGYDALPSFASYLTDSFTVALPFGKLDPGFDRRWNEESFNDFARLTKKFVDDSHGLTFIETQQKEYGFSIKMIEKQINTAINHEWFTHFFGESKGDPTQFKVCLQLIDTHNCYGTATLINGKQTAYCVYGTATNVFGFLDIGSEGLSMLVHEFCHTFSNPVVTANTTKLEKSGKLLFDDFMAHDHSKSYRNWTTVQYETFVRAAVLCYLEENRNDASRKKQIENDKRQGFWWTEQLARSFADLRVETSMYQSTDHYIRQAIKVYNQYLDHTQPSIDL